MLAPPEAALQPRAGGSHSAAVHAAEAILKVHTHAGSCTAAAHEPGMCTASAQPQDATALVTKLPVSVIIN
jgi:hypothetical protein